MSYRVIRGNARSLFDFYPIDQETIDLIITSPPYKERDGFSMDLIAEVMAKCYCASKWDSWCFMVFGNLAEDKKRPLEVGLRLAEIYDLYDTIIWDKPQYSPHPSKQRFDNCYEFVFQLGKGAHPNLDRLAVGVPYQDKSNIKRYGKGRDLHCGTNVWRIKYDTIQSSAEKYHPNRFPVELAEQCIKASGIPEGSTVLDPFAGSGSTLVACFNLGMHGIGIEIDKKYCEIARERLRIHSTLCHYCRKKPAVKEVTTRTKVLRLCKTCEDERAEYQSHMQNDGMDDPKLER